MAETPCCSTCHRPFEGECWPDDHVCHCNWANTKDWPQLVHHAELLMQRRAIRCTGMTNGEQCRHEAEWSSSTPDKVATWFWCWNHFTEQLAIVQAGTKRVVQKL